ncbi:MAG: 50S ribosomal protein L25 [Ignavibacteriales bacterium]|nr:50S ribosomal protein L25 [Ignavibacteriales bacterium]
MSEILVQGNKRTLSTKGVVNQLRRDGNVPGIYYTKGVEPIPVYVSEKALKPIVFTAETHIINLKIGDSEELKSILKNVQFDPVTDRVVHFDLLGISADQEIEIDVPLLFEGQAKGVKEGGVVQQTLHKLTVSCLPADIPDHIAINISELALGDSVHVRDLNIEKVKFVQHPDVIIVSVVVPRAAVEPTVAAVVPGDEKSEPEVITKGKQTEEEE